jgi:hypothetical protein
VVTLTDLRSTDYFEQIQKQIKKAGVDVSTSLLLRKMSEFDDADSGMIKAFKLVNILKHTYPGVFEESTLIGL